MIRTYLSALACFGTLALGGCEEAKSDSGSAVAASRPAPNPERNAYFGDLHLHTSYSTDAYLLGTGTTPDESYLFAKGEEVTYLGNKVRRKARLDFLAVTDHAEYLGVVRTAAEPSGPLSETRWGRWLVGGSSEGSQAAYAELLRASGTGEDIPEFENQALQRAAWEDYSTFADKHYDPGRFTTFHAFEWTSAPGNQNLHRNVIFRGDGPDMPYSSKESTDPEKLWDYMDRQRDAGLTLMAIPHNGNASNGLMFNTEQTLAGAPVTRAYWERRYAHEQLTEIAQVKGQSETHPLLSPNDEFANFELFEWLVGQPRKSNFMTGSYVRQAYGTGQELQERFGINPFKLGLVGGTDFHSGVTSTEEFNYVGSHGAQDADRRAVVSMTESFVGAAPTILSAAGLTGVWAEENTRESIYAALERKETFGTSGVRIRVRLFGGARLNRDMIRNPDWVRRAYAAGVPMGGDLPDEERAPGFIVQAVKDPDSGNLDRVQIVKVSTRNGRSTEQVFDVVWSGDRRPDQRTGKLPPIGSTVNVGNATYTNSIGSTELLGFWRDPAFDPKALVTYYARVIEVPTPRWSTYWSAAANLRPNPGVAPTIQERAWTSPIWYGARRTGGA
jgi:hypothetical protein